MTRVVATGVLAIALVCGCGAPPAPPLGPAGSRFDDGTGQLATASVRLRRQDGDDGDGVRVEDRYDRRHHDDLGGYGGYGYGGAGYGGIGGYGYGGIGYGPAPPQPPPYAGVTVTDGGAVEGSVRWKSGAGVAWPAGCDATRVARAAAPVAGAIVYLDGIRSGRAVPYAMALVKTGGVAEVTSCAILPATQLAGPLPTQLVVENSDRHPVRLHHERPGGVTTAELDPGGRTQLAIERVGETRLWDGVRAPAWIVAQAHPYYVVTGDDGRFVLDEVPPGTWGLVVWYPPLVLAVGADGPMWSRPTIERRRVTVGKAATVRVDVALAPAR